MLNSRSHFRLVGVALAVIIGTALVAAPAQADSSTGTIAVSLNITAACVVNGAPSVVANMGQIGALAFADQPGIFGNTDASLVATGGGSAISVLCSPGSTPTLTVGAGSNDSSGVHHLASGSGQVAYHLYTDSGRNNEISIGQQISLGTATSTAFSVPIFGRVSSGGQVLAAGSYTDTVQVTLAW